MSISVIASQQAITASPLSAATVGLLALLDPQGVSLSQILLVCIPATFLGCMIGALVMLRYGPELDEDPVYRERLERGDLEPVKPLPVLEGRARRNAVGSVCVFLAAAAGIVAFGLFPALRPYFQSNDASGETVVLGMPEIIQLLMYASAGVTMLAFGAKPDDAIKSKVGQAGVVAVISIIGLGWLGSCFFEGNREVIVGSLSEIVREHSWIFALGMFALSVLLFSQAATVAAMVPVGIALSLSPAHLIAFFPAVNGYFFLPTYGTIVAAIAFDQTGTTRIGKYVLNHSFMLPGLVSTASAILIGLGLSALFA